MGWQQHAACAGMGVDPHPFFPGQGEPTAYIKHVCVDCPVRLECLALGIREKYGIWGGLSEKERRQCRAGRRGDEVLLTLPGRPRRQEGAA